MSETTQIAEALHVMALEALLRARSWHPGELAFQGGTSLHLIRRSPRRSEDLDFMVALDDEEIARVMQSVCRRVDSMAQLEWPEATIECRHRLPDREANRMAHVMIKCQHPEVRGKVRVKVELLRVEPDELARYATEPRVIRPPETLRTTISSIVRAGTVGSIYVDKLTALPLRGYLKARDVFDLWWLKQQHPEDLPTGDELLRMLGANLQIYRCDLDAWCARCIELIDDLLDPAPSSLEEKLAAELQRFLPPESFQQIRDLVGFPALMDCTVGALEETVELVRASHRKPGSSPGKGASQ